MKTTPARLIEQGQQRGFEVLHLLFCLGAGLGGIRAEQGTETGDFIRQPVVLSRKDRNLLLGNSGSGLGLITLMLPKVCSVTPETDGGGFCFVTSLMLSHTMPLRCASALGPINAVALATAAGSAGARGGSGSADR
jgi:hypothetical protein